MYYVTPFAVSTIELVLFKSSYLNEDIITDKVTAIAKLINFLLCVISFTFRYDKPARCIYQVFFIVSNTACFKKTKANKFQRKFPVTFMAYDVYRSLSFQVGS
jgi:hypothetical protein